MLLNKTQTNILTGIFSLIIIFVLWLTMAPTQLGGLITYVIVDGISMKPGFEPGDLVLVREKAAYGVGDAVVYLDPNIDHYVFHRIVGTDLGLFTLQGDNNSWLDSYRPAPDEVVGKLWLRIPKLGKAIEWMRVPIIMSLSVGLTGVMLMFEVFKKPARDRKRKEVPSIQPGLVPQGTLYGLGIAALLFFIFGIYSFIRPANRPAENTPYLQEGTYFYSATGTAGVYDREVVQTGEPVFPKLTCFLNIGYTYNISSPGLQGISGSQKMYARIFDEQSGWQRTLPISTDTAFSGNSHITTASLDLCQVESIVNLVEAEAGLKQISYTLEIISESAFTATAGENNVSDSLSSILVFQYDKVHFYLQTPNAGTDPLYSVRQGLVEATGMQPNSVAIFGKQLPVWLMRLIAVAGFGFFIVALAVAGISLYKAAGQNEETRIHLKYSATMVDVFEQNLATAFSVIEVKSMDDLSRLAERHGTMILHMTKDSLHYYFVQSQGVTYRFVLNSHWNGIAKAQAANQPIAARDESANSEPVAVSPRAPRAPQKPAALDSQDKPSARVEYFIDIHAIQSERRTADRSLDYVINTGTIECVVPARETTILGKARLPLCDPPSAS